MSDKILKLLIITLLTLICFEGNSTKIKNMSKVKVNSQFTGAKEEVRLITLDPGHFHAALVQKNMYDQISPNVFVFAPKGSDLEQHLIRIENYNSRSYLPTSWKQTVYSGDDYLEKMLNNKPGNVVLIAGNNKIKTDYILKSVKAGLNVLADKPMVISPEKFKDLEKAFKLAKKNNVLLYDIMTERNEITSIIQRDFSQIPTLFGKLENGTNKSPAVENKSVHFFYKSVSGNPLIRPAWAFDAKQQGEAIVDVSTHLVDLVQWGCFPEQIIKKSDIEIISAKRWPTIITIDEFKKVTKKTEFPFYLNNQIENEKLNVFANGEMIYKLKGIYVKVTAEWKFSAPEGTGDTYTSIMRGTKCSLQIRQGKEENYKPTLYVVVNKEIDAESLNVEITKAINDNKYAQGLQAEKMNKTTWKISIPDKYKVGHEAHFGQVAEDFLNYLKAGKLPAWEVPNMIAKYYTTTEALKLALKSRK